eukprot:Hpha_TRINITY_DN27398_c0_g1::TRINITY_DN27398_c0_g1_i1::g.516::m.516
MRPARPSAGDSAPTEPEAKKAKKFEAGTWREDTKSCVCLTCETAGAWFPEWSDTLTDHQRVWMDGKQDRSVSLNRGKTQHLDRSETHRTRLVQEVRKRWLELAKRRRPRRTRISAPQRDNWWEFDYDVGWEARRIEGTLAAADEFQRLVEAVSDRLRPVMRPCKLDYVQAVLRRSQRYKAEGREARPTDIADDFGQGTGGHRILLAEDVTHILTAADEERAVGQAAQESAGVAEER